MLGANLVELDRVVFFPVLRTYKLHYDEKPWYILATIPLWTNQ